MDEAAGAVAAWNTRTTAPVQPNGRGARLPRHHVQPQPHGSSLERTRSVPRPSPGSESMSDSAGRSPGSRVKARCTPSQIPMDPVAVRPTLQEGLGRTCASRSPLTVAGTAAALGGILPHRIPHLSLFRGTGAIIEARCGASRFDCALSGNVALRKRIRSAAIPSSAPSGAQIEHARKSHDQHDAHTGADRRGQAYRNEAQRKRQDREFGSMSTIAASDNQGRVKPIAALGRTWRRV